MSEYNQRTLLDKLKAKRSLVKPRYVGFFDSGAMDRAYAFLCACTNPSPNEFVETVESLTRSLGINFASAGLDAYETGVTSFRGVEGEIPQDIAIVTDFIHQYDKEFCGAKTRKVQEVAQVQPLNQMVAEFGFAC